MKEVKGEVCPHCRKEVRVGLHGVVERYCGQELIRVARVRCQECRRTFRLLPNFVVPYKSCSSEQIEAVVEERGKGSSWHEVSRGQQISRGQAKRWVEWWEVVRSVMEAWGMSVVQKSRDWLRGLLGVFRSWKSPFSCHPL